MTYQLTTLSNGLRIASESLPGVETVAIAISVDVGARWEKEAQHGISHLLEHMAFKGTPSYSALEIAETFDAIGGHLNAYTSHEHTVYYAKVLKEHLPKATEILCDILQHSLFDQQELAKEQQVILQELAMHHDTPDDMVFDCFQETAFGDQALGRSILGTEKSITSHSSDDLKAFVAQHYHPSRMVISAAGSLDHDTLIKLVETHINITPAAPPEKLEPAHYIGGSSVQPKKLEQLQLVMGFSAMPITDDRYYQLQLLSTILGGGMSSRLFQEIREKRGLVYTIQSFCAAYQDVGLFNIYAATGEKEVAELIPVVCDQLKEATSNISNTELSRAKNQHKANLLMSRENTASVAEWIGRHILQFGDYRSANTISALVEKITVEDVQTLAAEIFTNPKMTLAALGPTTHVMSVDEVNQRLAA